MKTPLFLGLMSGASVLSLVRGFVIASLLNVESFGTYTVTLALGAFGSILISAGRVEQTQKTYPRLWAEGHLQDVLRLSDRTARLVALRALVLGCAAVTCCMLAGATSWVWIAIAATFFALVISFVSLYASALRASLNLHSMSVVGLERAMLSLVGACVGAWLWSWPGAIAGELLGGGLGAWFSRSSAMLLACSDTNSVKRALSAAPWDKSGKWFFVSALTSAVPSYLDRFFVATRWGSAAAGQYGFLMLFVTGANVVTGIIVQKIGPQLVQMAHCGASVRDQLRLAIAWIAASSAAYAVGMSVAVYLLMATQLSGLAMKFGIEIRLMILVTVLCFFQLAHIIEWMLISRDRERWVSIGATIHLAAVLIIAVLSIVLQWSLVSFLSGFVAAKAIHVVLLLWCAGSLVARESGISTRNTSDSH